MTTAVGTYPYAALLPWLEQRLPAVVGDGGCLIHAADDVRVAELLGFSRRTVMRWRHGQHLTAWSADQAAIRAGTHPALVWPTWEHDALELEAVG